MVHFPCESPLKGQSNMRSTCAYLTTEIFTGGHDFRVVVQGYTDRIRSLKTRFGFLWFAPTKDEKPHTSTQSRVPTRVCRRIETCLVYATRVYTCDCHPRMSRLSICESHPPVQTLISLSLDYRVFVQQDETRTCQRCLFRTIKCMCCRHLWRQCMLYSRKTPLDLN